MTEPGHLAFGVSPGGALRCRLSRYRAEFRLVGRTGAREDLPLSSRGGRDRDRRRRAPSPRRERRLRASRMKPGIASRYKSVSRRLAARSSRSDKRLPIPWLLPSPDGHSGGSHHLEGADQPLAVAGDSRSCGLRIKPRQALAKGRAAQRPMKLDRLLPNLLRDVRNRRQPLPDCPQVEPGAPDQDRQAANAGRVGDLAERERPPPRG